MRASAQPEGLTSLVELAGELATGSRTTSLDALLHGLREQLGFDVTFVGAVRAGRRVVLASAEAPGRCVLPAGTSDSLEDTYCARVLDGRLGAFVPNARQEPAVRDLPVTTALPVGTHLSVPILFSDGSVFGTLCGFTFEPDLSLREREVGMLRLLAGVVGTFLEREHHEALAANRVKEKVADLFAEGSCRIVLQPVVALASHTVVGYEALTRFDDGTAPDSGFSLAATVGRGVELEVRAVSLALGRLADLPASTYLAVNASAAALCSNQLLELLEGLPGPLGARVVIELTEQTGVPDYDLLNRRLDQFRGHGMRVAVDDAGAGYAGLQRILAVSPDFIKLDRALVGGVATDRARQSLAAAMVWFADRNGSTVVAEGIEVEPDARALQDLGVGFGQGFLLGPPGERP